MNGGDILFYFKGDDKDLDNTANGIGSKMGSVASGIGSAFLKGTAVAGGALAGLVGTSVKMAGDLEQQIGGTEAVFGEFADSIQTKANEAYSSMGMSANDYMATANKMGSLMQGSGIDQATAMDLSADAMQRASDVASIMGIDIASAMESITGAAKGNFTMMDNLGVAMNVTTLDAYALEKGMSKTYSEMSKGEQVQLAYQMFLEQTSQYAGNYAKENETFAGSLNTLQGAFGNFMSGAGDIDEVIDSLTKFGDIVLESVVDMAPRIVDGVVQLADALIGELPKIVETLLPTLIQGVMDLVTGLINALPQIVTMLAQMLPTILQQLINGLITIINSLAEMLPTLIPTIVNAILGLIPILIENLPLFIDAGIKLLVGLATGLVDAIPLLLDMLPTIIESLIEAFLVAIPQLVSVSPQIMLALAVGLIKAIPSLVKAIPEIIRSVVNGFVEGIDQMVTVGEDIVKGLWQGIKDAKDWIMGKIGGFVDDVVGGIKDFFGIKSPSRKMMYVGEMNAQGLVKGMEDEEQMIQSSFDSMFDLSPQLYGSSSLSNSSTLSPIIIVNQEQDPLGQMVNNIKTFSGGAKNDYNYGYGGVN